MWPDRGVVENCTSCTMLAAGGRALRLCRTAPAATRSSLVANRVALSPAVVAPQSHSISKAVDHGSFAIEVVPILEAGLHTHSLHWLQANAHGKTTCTLLPWARESAIFFNMRPCNCSFVNARNCRFGVHSSKADTLPAYWPASQKQTPLPFPVSIANPYLSRFREYVG